jgi:hypothetical protein
MVLSALVVLSGLPGDNEGPDGADSGDDGKGEGSPCDGHDGVAVVVGGGEAAVVGVIVLSGELRGAMGVCV